MRIQKLVWLISMVSIFTAPACLGSVVPYDPDTMLYPVTPTAAAQACRDWAGEPNLELTLEGVRMLSSSYYNLKSSDCIQAFEVDCETGEVFNWRDIPAQKSRLAKLDGAADPSTQLPAAALTSIVLAFLRERYADFDSLGMQAYGDFTVPTDYCQHLSSGAWYPRMRAICSVDEWTGEVVEYYGIHAAPANISVIATVSTSQAEQIALDYAGTLQVPDLDANMNPVLLVPQVAFVLLNSGVWLAADDLDLQRLTWEIDVVISPDPAYTPTAYAGELLTPPGVPTGQEINFLVDAHTGEIIYAGQAGNRMGASPPLDKERAAKMRSLKPDPSAVRSQPRFERGAVEVDGRCIDDLKFAPIRINDSGYLYVKYLPCLYGGTVVWDNGSVIVKMGNRSVAIRPDSTKMTVDGKTFGLRHPAKTVMGRVYVPCEAVRPICGATATWDAKEKVFRIQSGALPVKPQFRRPNVTARTNP